MPEQTTMTDAELTILSLVAEAKRYGHEIQQIIDDRGLREWVTIGFASVYYILNKLENQKLISGELRTGGRGPNRKQYNITDAGRGVLQTAIADLLRQPRSLGTGFELGLANITALKPRQVYMALKHHRTDLAQQLHMVEQSWQRHQDGEDVPAHIHALYTHSLAMMRAELDWLTNFVDDWLKRYPAVEQTPATDEIPTVTTSNAVTQIHRRATPNPDKMLQKLRRPKQPPKTDE